MMKSDQMKSSTVFRKTPAGEEAIQERRISQRNLRSVLIMVNGQASVAEITDRFGDPLVVEGLIAELEHRGLVELLDSASMPEDAAAAVASAAAVVVAASAVAAASVAVGAKAAAATAVTATDTSASPRNHTKGLRALFSCPPRAARNAVFLT